MLDVEFLHPLQGEVPAPTDRQRERLSALAACLKSARSLDEAFELLVANLKPDLPFDRVGLGMVTDGGKRLTSVRVESTHALLWDAGDSRPMLGSSLEPMFRERAVRIIHDLKGYQSLRPSSLSTKRLIEEGMRSSLAMPLYRNDHPLGVLFLTSAMPDAYHADHAGLLAALGQALNDAFGRLLGAPALV